jgi:outer membrane protein assembly factor BamD
MATRSTPAADPMRRIIIILLLFSLTACGLISKKDEEDETEGLTAEDVYEIGKGRLETGYYAGAIEIYEILEQRFPFGDYAQQALLDMAYARYKTEDPEEAISALERFMKLYPTHLHMDYAFYLRGLANFNRGKGITQRFLPTDASQRDQGAALTSFQDFSELIKRFPDSRYIDDAQLRMVYLRNILARHEVNVANYYMRREAYVAAVNRTRYVIEYYQQTPAVPDALVIMARAYKVLAMNDLADDALRVLEANYPAHPGLQDVRQILVR